MFLDQKSLLLPRESTNLDYVKLQTWLYMPNIDSASKLVSRAQQLFAQILCPYLSG